MAKKYLLSALNSSSVREYYTAVANQVISTTSCIPVMTSTVTPIGRITVSSEQGYGNYAFNAFDGVELLTELTGCWLTAIGTPSGWIRYDFDSPKKIKKYSISYSWNIDSAPKTWVFEHSTDGGTTWVTLHSVSAAVYNSNGIATYELDTAVTVSKIRITVSAVMATGRSQMIVSEIRVFDVVDNYTLTSVGTSDPTEATFTSQGFDDTLLAQVKGSNAYISLNQAELLVYSSDTTYVPTVNITPAKSGQIRTTAKTSVNVQKHAGVDSINVTGSGGRYLISFDGGTTWYNRKRLIGYSGSEVATSIPTMTSNTAPSGVASCSTPLNTNYDAYKAFDKTVTCYVASARCSVAEPTIIQYKFASPTVINKYGIYLYQSNGASLPKDWTYQGSLNGTDWVILDTKSVTGFSNGVQTAYQYPITNSTAYLYYRLVVTDLNTTTTGGMQITELEMYKAISLYGFSECDIGSISTMGMTKEELNGAVASHYADIFQHNSLDVAAYLGECQVPMSLPATADAMPTYTISCSSNFSTYYPYKALSGSGSFWASNGAAVCWWNIKFATPRKISKYSVGLTNVTTYNVLGRLAGGSWVVLDSHNTGLTAVNSQVAVARSITNPCEYDEYRFDILTKPGNNTNFDTMTFHEIIGDSLSEITVDLPPNSAPKIINLEATPDNMHRESVTVSCHIQDAEKDSVTYKVYFNGEEYQSSGPIPEGGKINIVFPDELFKVGMSAVKIEAIDETGLSSEDTIYITRVDTAPKLTGVLSGNIYRATIGDDENDKVQYRILFNNVEKTTWSSLKDSPYNISYEIDRQDINFGVVNKLRIEFKDEFGLEGFSEEEFVGSYYGLLFQDAEGDFFSSDLGVVIKKLDFGTIIASQKSLIKEVVVHNKCGFDVANLKLNIPVELNTKVYTHISPTESPFIGSNTLDLGMLPYNTKKSFFIQVSTSKESYGGGDFIISAKADPL